MASETENPNRRDFLTVAATSWAAVGAAATLWPLVQQMNPDASTQALASVEIDLTSVKEGQAITVMWRGKPVFIRNRTKAEIDAAKAVDVATLTDHSARNLAMPEVTPADDANHQLHNYP